MAARGAEEPSVALEAISSGVQHMNPSFEKQQAWLGRTSPSSWPASPPCDRQEEVTSSRESARVCKHLPSQ